MNVSLKLRKKESDLPSQFIVVREIHNQYKEGHHFLMQDTSSGSVLMKKAYIMDTPEQVNDLADKLQPDKSHKNVIKFVDYSLVVKSNFCSKLFQVDLFYEYPLNDLYQEWQIKKAKSQVLHEEVMQLMYDVLSGLLFFERNFGGHGLLQLFSVFKAQKDYKISNKRDFDEARQIYVNYVYDKPDLVMVVAPELLQAVAGSTRFDALDWARVDSFHLGMILLIYGNLRNNDKLVDVYKFKFNSEELKRELEFFGSKFRKKNGLLVEIVERLVVEDPGERLAPSELANIIPKAEEYSQVIIDKNRSKDFI